MHDPPAPDPERLTRFLNQLAAGRDEAAQELMPYVHGQLRLLAAGCMRDQPAGHTLQPTALVNEAFMKLFEPARVQWNDRKHFFAVAARAMRQVLVDHARGQRRLKRGEGRLRVTLDHALVGRPGTDLEILDLETALEELNAEDERQGRIVELRFFGGLDVGEVADILKLSKSTVEREWRAARVWLGVRLESLAGGGA